MLKLKWVNTTNIKLESYCNDGFLQWSYGVPFDVFKVNILLLHSDNSSMLFTLT